MLSEILKIEITIENKTTKEKYKYAHAWHSATMPQYLQCDLFEIVKEIRLSKQINQVNISKRK